MGWFVSGTMATGRRRSTSRLTARCCFTGPWLCVQLHAAPSSLADAKPSLPLVGAGVRPTDRRRQLAPGTASHRVGGDGSRQGLRGRPVPVCLYNISVIIYDARFWNSTTKSWTHDRDQLQTVSSISLGAGIGPARRAEAVAALHKDVASRQYHLTVGSVGAKWLLRTLSEEGKHDTALRVALQTTFPSWGWWLGKGAMSCWERCGRPNVCCCGSLSPGLVVLSLAAASCIMESWTGINGPDEGRLPEQQGGQATHNQ